jgi:hypothetical protein
MRKKTAPDLIKSLPQKAFRLLYFLVYGERFSFYFIFQVRKRLKIAGNFYFQENFRGSGLKQLPV